MICRQPTSVDEFIYDAASSNQNHAEEQIKNLKLRVPADLLAQIDNSVKTRHASPSSYQ